MILVGLNGRKRSGKDTLAQMMIEQARVRGLKVVRRGFADQLKLSAARAFYPDIELNDAVRWCDTVKESGVLTVAVDNDYGRRVAEITGREWLQRYGTESHRDVFGPDFWVDALIPVPYPGRNFDGADIGVVTDARFANEAVRVRLCGGYVVNVSRPEVEDGSDAHASEAPLDDGLIDYWVLNDGSLDDLQLESQRLLDWLTHYGPRPS